MIIKEDTPAVFTGRPISVARPVVPTSPSLPPLPSDASTSTLPLPLTPVVTETESIPSYRPPSFPPQAHIPTPDPAPWQSRPPPRYKYRKRPSRFVPLLGSVALAAIVLGSCVNFMVETVIRIATTHIKPQMFFVFHQILPPTNLLLAASVVAIVLLPIHHLLPVPTARLPFRTASHRHRALVISRLLLPILSFLLYAIGGFWFLAIALQKDNSASFVDEKSNSTRTELGNGVEVELDPNHPKDGNFWSPWFFSDPNVKMVLFSTLAAALFSVVYLLNAIPGSWVHKVFTGVPPKKLGRVEQKVMVWWTTTVLGRESTFDEAELEGIVRVGVEEGMDDQVDWRAGGGGANRRAGDGPFGRRFGLERLRDRVIRRTGNGGGRTGAGPLSI